MFQKCVHDLASRLFYLYLLSIFGMLLEDPSFPLPFLHTERDTKCCEGCM